MKFEFENEKHEVDVIEYIVRDISHFDDEEGVERKAPHFQARLRIKDYDPDDNLGCVISYYDQNGEFIGLDKDSVWNCEVPEGEPLPISIPINIPEQVVKAKIRFTYDTDKPLGGFYSWAGKAATFMGLMLLFSWVMNSFGIFK